MTGGQQRRVLVSALRTNLPWARVAGATALVGLPGFSLAVGWVLLRRPGLLRGGPLRRTATDFVVAALTPVTLLAVVLALAFGGWPLNVLVSVGLLVVDAVMFMASAAKRGAVWVLDGWRAGVMVTRKEPYQGRARFEIAQYWALPPGRGHGRRLRQEGTELADRLGVVLELEAMNLQLAEGTYRHVGFEIVAEGEQERRLTMRRAPRSNNEPTRQER